MKLFPLLQSVPMVGASLLIFVSGGHSTDECAPIVTLDQINRREVNIVGALGVPIGDAVTIHGNWVTSRVIGKHGIDGNDLEILQINNCRLQIPIRFHYLDTDILIDHETLSEGQIRAVAFETVHCDGIPEGVWKKNSNPGARKQMSPVPSRRAFGVYSRLTLVRVGDETVRE